MSTLLEIQGLTVEFRRGAEIALRAIEGLDLTIFTGETLALVGSSGSGKSVLAHAILGLVPRPGRVVAGRVVWRGRDLLALHEQEINRVRGAEIAMISQNARLSLNPSYSIGRQLCDIVRLHQQCGWREARERTVRMLEDVQAPEAASRLDDYPHQFSQGMCQRIMIAAALVCQPRLLIADEPTASLDVIVQRQIVDLLRSISARRAGELSILFISHDLGVVAQLCDRVAVMREGRIAELGTAEEVYSRPRDPYTRQLLEAVPVARPVERAAR
jgi:ABC-type dipeptide/oligopeptide/nickel transport system ATPase component